ncbi:hypothetical protein PRIPAC_74950, partial [Pristionchus pacificus]
SRTPRAPRALLHACKIGTEQAPGDTLMDEFALNYDYPIFTGQGGDGFDQMQYSVGTVDDMKKAMSVERSNETPLPPIVICPSEVEHINITLEKNQQCACKDCGKLFNSVWYLKQHAVKHSNDRPFKCKFCFKTYKFRSNLYQHKCPDRQKSGLTGRRGARGTGVGIPNLPGTPTSAVQKARLELKMKLENGGSGSQPPSAALANGATTAQQQPSQQQQSMTLEEAMTSSAGAFAPPPPASSYQQPMHGTVPANGVSSMHLGGYSEEAEDAELSYGLCIRIEPEQPPAAMLPPREEVIDRPPDCIRLQPMSYEEVERYVSTNKTKIHTCRKCKTHFPSEETLERHNAAHRHEETHCFRCDSCPQTFGNQMEFARHVSSHASMGPWSCDGCSGCFRSNVALRRHVDACRPCRYRPFDMPVGIIETASSPLDPSSFIISEADTVPSADFLEALERSEREKAESGIGSSPESSLLHTSPARSNTNTVEDDFDENLSFSSASSSMRKKKANGDGHDDDADSGFRSRLNSVTQSCSPSSSSSAFSSDGGSPHRKSSHDAGHTGISFGISQFGMGAAYGQKLLIHEQPVGGQFNTFSSLSSSALSFASPSFDFSGDEVTVMGLAENSIDAMAGIRAKESLYIDEITFVDPRISLDADDSCPPPPFFESAEPIDTVEPTLIPLLLRYVLRTLLPYTALTLAARQHVSMASVSPETLVAEQTRAGETSAMSSAGAEQDEEDRTTRAV